MDLYSVLGVMSNATQEEIKVAYKHMIRKYPPEINTEKFKEIREAYEILNDRKLRLEYDIEIKYGSQIEIIEARILKVENEGDIEFIINERRRILKVIPNWTAQKNKLAIALMRAKRYSEALSLYNEIIEEENDEPLYYENRAYVYLKLGKYEEGRKDFFKVYKLSGELENISKIAWMYWNGEEKDKAIIYLKKFIKEEENKYKTKELYKDLLKFYAVENEMKLFEKSLDELIDIVSKKYCEKEADFLEEIAVELISGDFKKESLKVLEKALEIDKGNLRLKNKYIELTNNCKNSESSINDLRNDRYIIKPLKDLIELWINDDILEEQRYEITEEILYRLGDMNGNETIKSIEYLKKRYREFYNLNPEFLENILSGIREEVGIEDENLQEVGKLGKFTGNVIVGIIVLFIIGVIIELLPYIIKIGGVILVVVFLKEIFFSNKKR